MEETERVMQKGGVSSRFVKRANLNLLDLKCIFLVTFRVKPLHLNGQVYGKVGLDFQVDQASLIVDMARFRFSG